MTTVLAKDAQPGDLVDIAPFVTPDARDAVEGEYATITAVVPLDGFVVRLENDIENVAVRAEQELDIPED